MQTPDNNHQPMEFNVPENEAGKRLDRYLSEQFEVLSRSRLKTLIKEGNVCLNGATLIEPNYRVKPGDEIEIMIPPLEDPIPKSENLPLNIVYEDDALIVIDKPAGLVVHPAAGNWTGTLVNALIAHCGDSLSGIGGVRRPGIVHRLDKDTSGLIVVAKTDQAHQGLASQFADHSLEGPLDRRYLALVWGAPNPAHGVIDAPLARAHHNRQKMAVVREGGKNATTHYATKSVYVFPDTENQIQAQDPTASLIECQLETGRTHQIRVHMAFIGHPLIGDHTYGSGFKTKANKLPKNASSAIMGLDRQALHAAILGFRHPLTGEDMRFSSPPPRDLTQIIDLFEEWAAK